MRRTPELTRAYQRLGNARDAYALAQVNIDQAVKRLHDAHREIEAATRALVTVLTRGRGPDEETIDLRDAPPPHQP